MLMHGCSTSRTAPLISVDQQMDDFARALNVGYGLLDNWHVRIKSNKAPVIAEINSFRTILEHAKEKLDSLRVAYLNCPDVTEALNTNTLDRLFYSIDGFYRAIDGLSSDLPENYENLVRPYSGALKRDLDTIRGWQTDTKRLTALRWSPSRGSLSTICVACVFSRASIP